MTSGVVAAAAITVGATCGGAAAADLNASMVKDLSTYGVGSDPASFATLDGQSFFVANDRVHGRELWKSDGTAAGTVMVKDIYPGSSSSFYGYGGSTEFVEMGGKLYFTASNSSSGAELWKTDGTEAGTTMVKDIGPGWISSSPSDLTVMDGKLYFAADNGSSGTELWKSDGTDAGTQLVKDIYTGTSYGYANSSRPSDLTALGSTLYFTARDGANGAELWKSDGSSANTTLVKDIHPGSYGAFSSYSYYSSSSSELTVMSGKLYFAANDGTHGTELWTSNGTDAGTQLVKDIDPDGGYYGSDYGSRPNSLTALGSTLYFTADDGIHGRELWKSNGTPGDATLVKDIRPGSTRAFSSYGTPEFTEMGGKLYFAANNGSNGTELWKSDGTDAGTQLVKDIYTGTHSYYGGSEPNSSNPSKLTALGSTLYFTAADGTHGTELWKSDGNSANTTLVKDIRPGDASAFYSYGYGSSSGLTVVSGKLHFAAGDDANGTELWTSDGSAAGTRIVKDISNRNHGSNPRELTDFKDSLYFRAYGDSGSFWKSDGTAAGTVTADGIFAGNGGSSPQGMRDVNGTLYFSANHPTAGRELWKSDGTAAGTQLVKDIRPGSSYGYNSSYPYGFTAVGGTVYFSANNGTNGTELWKTDGTAAGTVMVRDIRPGSSSSSPSSLTAVGNTIYFAADNGTNGHELWKSDGTAAGTQLVKDIYPGTGSGYYGSYANSSGPSGLTALGNTLYFTAGDGVSGTELWKSDGSAAGTTLVKDIRPGGSSSFSSYYASEFAELGGKLYFAASNGTQGHELWATDGTAAGTVMVKDIQSGPGGSMYSGGYYSSPGPTTIGGKLYFAADNGLTGPELWESNGSAAGTVLVKDLLPGPEGSDPSGFTASGGKLFFSASDGAHGAELWKGDLDGLKPIDPDPTDPDPTDPVPVDNRFKLPKDGKVNLKKGTVTVRIKLPGPGTLAAVQNPAPKKKKKKAPVLVKPAKVKVKQAGFVNVVLKPAKAGLKMLKKRGKKPKVRKFKVPVRFTYTPTGGKPSSQKRSYLFKRR